MTQHNLTTSLDQMPFTCRLNSMGLVRVSGPDAKKFLQGQVTCDVNEIPTQQAILGAFCSPQGRVKALFHLVSDDQDLILLMPKEIVPVFLDGIKKYAVFFKTQLTDVTEAFDVFGVYANERPAADKAYSLSYNEHRHFVLMERNHTLGEVLSEEGQWRLLDVIDGVPHVLAENSDKLLPHHINLPALGGVNFKKGCYTGQEIIARMEYKATIKTHLQRGVVASENVLIGTEVMSAERGEGEIVTCAPLGNQRCAVLFTLNDAALSANLHLGSESLPILERVDPQ